LGAWEPVFLLLVLELKLRVLLMPTERGPEDKSGEAKSGGCASGTEMRERDGGVQMGSRDVGKVGRLGVAEAVRGVVDR
jgi:hypothetical protein